VKARTTTRLVSSNEEINGKNIGLKEINMLAGCRMEKAQRS